MRSNFINNLRNLTQENINRVHRNARRLYKNLITRYKQGVREAEYEYRRDLEESHNRNKPSLSEYEKEYIRLWNLSGSVRKNIITDVEKEALKDLDLFTHFCTPNLKIEIVRECCNRVIIPIMKNIRITHKKEKINIVFDRVFEEGSYIEYGIRYNNKFLDKNIPLVEDMKKGLLREYSNVPFRVLEEYRKFDINNFDLLVNGKFTEYRKSLKNKKENIENFEKIIQNLIHYEVKTPYEIVKILLQNIKEYQILSSITNITSKDIVINVIKKSLAKMFLENNDIEYFKIAQDLNKNGLKNFKILKNKVDNNTLKRDLENYKKLKKNITDADIGLCILKQVQLVHVSENTNVLWGDLVDSTLSNPIDISKGVEFYLNESFNIDIYKREENYLKLL